MGVAPQPAHRGKQASKVRTGNLLGKRGERGGDARVRHDREGRDGNLQRLNAGRIVLHPFGSTDGPSLGNLHDGSAGVAELRVVPAPHRPDPVGVPVALIVPVAPRHHPRLHVVHTDTQCQRGRRRTLPGLDLYPSHLHADGVGGYPAGHAVRLLLSLCAKRD